MTDDGQGMGPVLGVLEALPGAMPWAFEEWPHLWGLDDDDPRAWAMEEVRKRLELVRGRLASGMVHEVEQLHASRLSGVEWLTEWPKEIPDGWVVLALPPEQPGGPQRIGWRPRTSADDRLGLPWLAWPWGRDEGRDLCRASSYALEEAAVWANEALRGWEGRAVAAGELAAADGVDAWRSDGKRPALVLRIFLRVAAEAWKKRDRFGMSMLPPLLPAALRGKSGVRQVADANAGRPALGVESVAGMVIEGPALQEALARAERSGDQDIHKALTLAAEIARRVYAQWKAGDQYYNRVVISASEASSQEMGLQGRGGTDLEELIRMLRILEACSIEGMGALVSDVRAMVQHPPGGGRPRAAVELFARDPLCPYGVEEWREKHGIRLPAGLRFYGPALDSRLTPLVGNRRTYAIQRAAYAVGLGQWLMSRREEYAERRGVKLDTLSPFLEKFGLYSRSHASLADNVADSWRSPPKMQQLELSGVHPAGPVLVELEPGSGIYRTGDSPELRAAERAILKMAEITVKQRLRSAGKRWRPA